MFSEVQIRVGMNRIDFFPDDYLPTGILDVNEDNGVTRSEAGTMFGKLMTQIIGLTACFFITCILWVSHIVDIPPHTYVNMLFGVLCGTYSISGGSIFIDVFRNANNMKDTASTIEMAMWTGGIAITNGFIYIIDLIVDYLANKKW
ncbi:uncharacterized protein [Periplaneta americana]|uniref:uncharacterized protein n=1 Tax=Periplaneta americana TaxID=6978 RepID=UPI0037E8736F